MQRTISLLVLGLLSANVSLQAQTADLVLFTDDGMKFTLVIDGEQKNDTPAARVVATGIRNETPVVMVRFEDPGIPMLKKAGYFPLGMEYTVMITSNKRGERVLRPTGEAPLGTAAGRPEPFIDDTPPLRTVDDVIDDTDASEERSIADPDVEKANMNVGVNGLGVNMNVNVSGPTTTTTTTITTTTTLTETPTSSAVAPQEEAPTVYHMPGYSGPIGCDWPMAPGQFGDAKRSISGKSFEDSKLTVAMQVAKGQCFTVDQVKEVMGLFSFEQTKLDFAKFAYDHTFDIGNYYKVNDAFSFESSMDELNEYLRSR
ncbi:MAG: DUF4476 domain-containing protein [Flavobacteriales bacterium]|nr:DUF4476 domain-containing protein [Flavobacteriales bacterium]